MSCFLEIKDSQLYKALKKRFGSNELKIFKIWNHVVENDEFTEDFQKWQQAKRKTESVVTLDTINTRTIVNDVLEYYNKTKPDGNDTVLDTKDDNSSNYNSISDRLFCIKIVGAEMLDIFRDRHYKKFIKKRLNRQGYIDAVRNQFYNRILNRLGISDKDIKNKIDLKRYKGLYIGLIKLGETKDVASDLAMNKEIINIAREMLGKQITIQDMNLLATFEEMNNSVKNDEGIKISDAFFNAVFSNSNLDEIRRDIKDEFSTEQENKAQINEDVNLGDNAEEDVNDVSDVFDITIRVLNNHDGLYNTFTTHIGGNIRSYLNSLRKLASTGKTDGKYSYNTDNAIGIADTMNANECAVVLYTQADYSNIENMIKSIKRIAERTSGFESFAQLADDLESNYDFAYEFYRTFGKIVISKIETYIEDGVRKNRISNNTSSRAESLRFEYMNSMRNSATDVISDYVLEEVSKIADKIAAFSTHIKNKKTYNPKTKKLVEFTKDSTVYKTDKNEIIASLTENLKLYIPEIDQSAIINFINDNKIDGVVDEVKNMNLLKTSLNDLIRGAHNTKLKYVSKQAQAAAIARKNRIAKTAMAEGAYIDPDTLENPNDVWNEDLLTEDAKKAAIQLADLLLPYSIVKVDLNSRNAQGNLSSDVINSSMMTNFIKMLQSELNTEDNENSPIRNYAAYKFRGKQYDLSNILIEKVKDGITINKGLFKLVDGKYVPTDYASSLIKISLFNGISDFGSGKSALYSTMSKGDYITTAMINFHKSSRTVDNIALADYMMRIPSDAPKIFVMTAPKYNLVHTEGKNIIKFWEIENESEVNKKVERLINNISHKNLTDYTSSEFSGTTQEVDVDDATKILTGTYSESLYIDKKAKAYNIIDKESKDAYVTLSYGSVVFIVKGTMNATNTKLENVKLHGVIDNFGNNVAYDSDLKASLKNYYKNQLIKGKIKLDDGSTVKRKINRKHPIFQQFYFAFQQEMQNAATAITKLFEHKNGQILFNEKGEPIFSDYFSQLANPDRATYENYHRKKNEYIDKNGEKHTEKGIIQNIWLPVKDESGKTLYWEKTNKKRLSGNVFTSDRFTIFDEATGEERNFLNEVLDENETNIEDGKIHILYGEASTNSNLHIDDAGNVVFTAAQQKLIEDKIEEFIQYYVQNNITTAEKFENLFDDVPHEDDDIAEFSLNYHLAYINCNDLFEGDSKFYKDSQTFLKRAKETQGSGVPYGIFDITAPMFGEIHKEVKYSYLNSDEMQAIVGKLNNCKQFTTFRAATITNVVRTSVESQTILVDQLTENFVNEGLKREDARKRAETMMKGYTNTKVDDAQSYITFEEWIRRISARGQLHKYKPLIEAILDESKPLDVSDINEFIQVQKNFYYDMAYNEATGVMAPRQIKNAEFVLVPRLIKGTELEAVYKAMIHYGIDQLNTEEASKAGKVNVLTLWDKDGNLTKEWLSDFNANISSAIETFNYNNLYTQQETPQHVNAENKAGIQVMKKIIDNIDPNGPLGKYKEHFLKNYSQNVFDSFAELMTELNIELDENGNIKVDDKGRINGIDYDVFLSKFRDEMIRLGLDSNMLDFAIRAANSSEDKSGQNGIGLQTRMPAILNASRKKAENISQAIFNNSITRQTLPGFHAAQITQVGFKPLNNTVSKRIYSKHLRYHPDGERHVEVMLPASAFGMNRNDEMWSDIRKKYENEGLSVEEIENKIDEHMLSYIQNKGLDTFIGYRIPTEGKQSICVMKVVGFTPDAYGSTIVVPDDWVAQTGSDFDIDSVYGITYTTKKTSKGIEKVEFSTDSRKLYISYILSKLDKDSRKELSEASYKDTFSLAKRLAKENNLMSYDDYCKIDITARNSRAARNNQILDAMIAILQSDEALEENLSQSQFTKIIEARDAITPDIDKARRNARSPYNFFDQAEYQEDAMSGAKLKAFSVTLDTFCSVCNTVKPIFSRSIDIVYTGDKAKFEELRKRFDTEVDGRWEGNVVQLDDNHILVKHTGLGYSNDNKNVSGDIITAYSSQTTAHILDAIKEGAVKNVNDLTFGIYKLFPNIGSDYNTAIAFITQPAVTEIVSNYNKNKSIYTKEYENPVEATIKSIAKQLGIKVGHKSIDFITAKLDELCQANGFKNVNVLNAERLEDRLNEREPLFSSPVKRLLFDYLVAKKYKELSDIAGKIGKLTRVTNPDKFGAKQTLFATNEVFDNIREILLDDQSVFITSDGKSFLEAIYPGISNITSGGIDSYIKHPNTNSAYTPLNNFLKYVTATSIKISRELFVTQQPQFIEAIKQIKDIMSGDNPRLSEDTYNSFEKYVLCDLYSQIPIIFNPVTYTYGKGIDYLKDSVEIEKEKERIFGYGYQPNLKTIDAEGNYVKFAPADMSHPTDEEIAMFAKFTPAQKVEFIKKHFEDGLVCKYLKTNLINGKQYRKNKVGAQTIEFIEDSADREVVYEEFRNTFANKNPLLVLTAMDIIKYSFVVEGYQIRKNALNKVIDNDILVEEKGLYGTGIVQSLVDIVGNFASNPDTFKVGELTELFVRSHSNMPEISHTWFSKNDMKNFRRYDNGILAIDNNAESSSFLIKHSIGYSKNDTIIPNSYIKVRFGKNKETLYKIISNYDMIYLTPLNLLQESESGELSANMDNNNFPPASYYSDVFNEYCERYNEWSAEEFIKIQKEKSVDDYKATKRTTNKVEKDLDPINDWDINDSSIGGIVMLKRSIENHFDGSTNKMLILESTFLQDKIKGIGIQNGITKIVNGKAYHIYRLNTRKYSEVAGEEGSKLFKYTSKKGLNAPIAERDKPFEELINRARNRGIDAGRPGESHINYAYAVVPAVNSNEVRNSSVTEQLIRSNKQIRKEYSNDGDVFAERYVQQMSKQSIESNKKSISDNLENVTISTAEYVSSTVDSILNGENSLNLFTQDPDTGSYLKITDPKVIELIRESPRLRRKYLQTLLKAKHLIDTYESFANANYGEDNETLKYYISKINKEIEKLSKSPILKEAEELYVTGYLAKISTNPNIKNDIISLLDSYHTTTFISSWINDLQDTTNPIIQIIASDVMSDIRAKEFQGEQRIREFKKHISNLKAKAAKNGRTINWDNIIDEYGKFINDYNEQFIEDLENLRNAKDEAYDAYKKAETDFDKHTAFEVYLRKKHEYDKWKLDNVNQEFVDDYYKQMIALESTMINSSTGKFIDVYVQYKMLTDKLRDVFSHKPTENLDAHFEKQKNEILLAIAALKSDAVRTAIGTYEYKKDYEPYELSSDPITRRNQNINSLSAANSLRTFINSRNKLNDEFNDSVERLGFRDQLDRYLSVVNKYENSGRTTDDLYNIPEYANAKNWIKQHAYYEHMMYKENLSKDEVDAILDDYFEGNIGEDTEEFAKAVKAACEYMKYMRGNRANKNAKYKLLAYSYDARDENGVIDARKFTKEDIAKIKEEQEARYGIGESVPYSERGIIHSATTDDTIYSDEFYKGMKVDGMPNSKYLELVKQINDILRNAINPSTGVLETSTLAISEIEALLNLFAELGYDRTEQVFNTANGIKKKRGVKRKQVKKVIEFINKNVEFVLSEEDKRRFEAEKYKADMISKNTGGTYYLAWCELNQEWDEAKQEFVPNHLLWGHAQPKSSLPKAERDAFIAKRKTAAVRIIGKAFVEKPSKYYYIERSRMIDTYGVNSDEFKEWENNNHIYNPHTHRFEPLVCWLSSEPSNDVPGEWVPSYDMTEQTPKPEYKNDEFRKGLGVPANYKNNGNKYKRTVNLNEEERELKEYLQSVLASLATTKKAKRYIEQGNLPTKSLKESKSASKVWLMELFKAFGYVDGNQGYERWDNDVSYEYDYVPDMPMLQQLVNKDTHHPPYREMYKTAEEYNKAKEEYEKNKDKYNKENREIHKSLIDRDWETVISEFIGKAAHYNAVQENKYQLYFGQKLINDIQVYRTSRSNPNKLVKDTALSTDEDVTYKKEVDTNLQAQYTNFIRRVIFDQYKENKGKKTRMATILQGITSTNYMTLNIRGGISNILVGETNIWGEMWAKEYFGTKDWLVGKEIWTRASASFMANMYKDTSTSLADAIVKGFKVVDYAELTGRPTQVGLEEWSKRLRDAAFSPQTIGEHFMQNAAMFSMMMSHRIVSNPRYGEPGEAKYTFMNLEEYIATKRQEAIPEDELDNYIEFTKTIKDNPNVAKDYAWFKKDPVTQFVTTKLNEDKQDEFLNKEKEIRNQAEKDFRENPTVYSQFKLGEDGKLAFADDSILLKMSELSNNQEVSDAYKLMGKFRARVISVNKKIHGNYGKLDSARLESKWFGSLFMQYHKHIHPGIMKRWRVKGYWNEERGTVEKGSYIALYDFLKAPIEQIAARNRLTEGQTEALKGIQNVFGVISDYFHFLKLNLNIMPEYERANMRRILGDVSGMLVAIMGSLLLRLGWDDDDDSIIYNLGLYEMDRLASETFMWNPIGMFSEAKKLWSSPVAAQSIISDALNIMGTISGIILEGEDYNPYFQGGRYHGQHKLGVYFERRIPYWRNWVAIRDIADNNHYYKMGDNILSWFDVKSWAESIKN